MVTLNGTILSWKEKQTSRLQKKKKKSENLLDGYESAEVLMVDVKDCLEEWILDSGCTFHMTPLKHYFS